MSSNWSSGTNVIKEVDQNKNLTLQMLELKKQGGGTEYFVRKNDVKLGTKSVTQNGTYTAASDSKYGFSQFSVNVRGGNGSADSHGKPTGGDIKPGGAGSAVVGTDPTTGNDVAVGVDENGNLVQTPVPSGIKIVTPPTKTDYVYQEDMDYSGLVVKMINRDGTTFTDVGHPNGHLAVGELVLPVEKAPAASSTTGKSTSSLTTNLQQPIDWCTSFIAESSIRQWEYSVKGARIILCAGYGSPYAKPFILSNNSSCLVGGRLRIRRSSDDPWPEWGGPIEYEIKELINPFTINGKTVYGYSFNYWLSDAFVSANVPWYTTDPDQNSCWTVVYGDYTGGGTVDIPVQWNNPYTGDTQQDTFQITSTSADGDAHTSTSSNGTEGSGGGGTF